MSYKTTHSLQAEHDLNNIVKYITCNLKNQKAASDFLDCYVEGLELLERFPFAYKLTGIKIRGYEVRIKKVESYNMFFSVDIDTKEITVLRILYARQDWDRILQFEYTY